ncbi:serine hydrolase domain-containing protein [Cryptosporangium aurantiacum]|uniref:CubicO group peptidase, beta-lactamase class C family n=1 Tax=Cryptosporangium aurantiacum TaxID=134849 RepID=A0A1M7RBL4_9ACTN|nr:serine hydrolase domain-containing protein [Cryptosporangium aurantiacum]SHN43591.1 CubicO group peptidase, beta-lactamase class C family [Cryptosporangium aurantiacum]
MTTWKQALRSGLAGCLIALTLVAAPIPAGAAASVGELASGEQYLRAYMDQVEAPGLAYAVIRGDEVLRQGAWGVDGDGRPMTTRTPFLLGSTSKSFTALAVAQLAEAGRVDLDTPASTYLPWLRLGNANTARTVTVRQLLTHTSGLPQVWSTDLTDRYDNRSDGLVRSVRDLAGLRPTAAVGQTYEYSDANYLILGALVEAVTGDTFGEYLRRHVLGPLRMTRSAATADEADAVGIPAGHRYYFGRPQRFAAPFDTAGVPYGFLAASLEDLSHYTIAQLNGGRYGDARVLGPEATARMQTGTVDAGHGTYGFGWRNSTLDGVGTRIVWHAGATPDYFTHVVLAPDSDLAVILMTNIYGLPMDGPLSAGAFNLTRILHGGTPAAATADPIHTWTLAGLLGVAAVLLVVLTWSWIRPVRAWRRGSPGSPGRSRGRTIVTTSAWVLGCAGLAAVAAWTVPSFWKGAGLAKLQLWAPDIGHAIGAVVALSAVLALTRLGLGVHALITARPGSDPRVPIGRNRPTAR